jgi:hypothetical protein
VYADSSIPLLTRLDVSAPCYGEAMQPEPVPPGVDLVWAEAEKRLEAQTRQADALDTKAGVLIGVHALAAGLIGTLAGRLQGVGRWVGTAVVAVLLVSLWLSLLAFRAQDYSRSPSPEVMWRFAEWDPRSVRYRLVSTRFEAIAENRQKLRRKARLVSASLGILGVIASTVGAASIVGMLR